MIVGRRLRRVAFDPNSRTSRLRLFIILGGMSAFGPASMDIYLPGLPAVTRDLGISPVAAGSTVTTFLLGMGLGQAVLGTLSDSLGRRRPLFVGLGVYVLATVACASAPSIYVLDTGRLFQGAGASVGLVLGRAVVRDLYSGARAAAYFSRLVLIIGLAPAIAPSIGGQLLRVTSWRGLFVAVLFFVIVVAAVAIFWLPETLPPDRRIRGGFSQTIDTFRYLLRDRSFLGYAVTLGVGAGVVISYVAGAPFLIETVHGASPRVFGILFGLNAVGMILVSQVNAHLVGRVQPRRLVVFAMIITLSAASSLVLATGLGLSLWAIAPCLFVLMSMWGVVPANMIALALNDHPGVAGGAAAILGVSQYGIGGLVGPLAGLGARGNGVPLAVLIFILSVLALLFVATLTRPDGRSVAVEAPGIVPVEV